MEKVVVATTTVNFVEQRNTWRTKTHIIHNTWNKWQVYLFAFKLQDFYFDTQEQISHNQPPIRPFIGPLLLLKQSWDLHSRGLCTAGDWSRCGADGPLIRHIKNKSALNLSAPLKDESLWFSSRCERLSGSFSSHLASSSTNFKI